MTDPGPEAAGRRFRTYFTAVCIHIRQDAHASLAKVGDLVGIDSNSVRRFEKGETFPHKNLEHYAAAYGALTSPPIDPRDVFLRAATWWRRTGLEPLLVSEEDDQRAEEPTPARIVADIRRAESIAQARAQAAEPPSATRKRRKGAG